MAHRVEVYAGINFDPDSGRWREQNVDQRSSHLSTINQHDDASSILMNTFLCLRLR